MHWLWALSAIAAGLMATWVLLAVLAQRLPEGRTKELIAALPRSAVMARRLFRDPRVPRRVKIGAAIVVVWVASPIDLVPEFIPVIGPLDDLIVVAVFLRWAAKHVPIEAFEDAWPGDPTTINAVLGWLRRKDA